MAVNMDHPCMSCHWGVWVDYSVNPIFSSSSYSGVRCLLAAATPDHHWRKNRVEVQFAQACPYFTKGQALDEPADVAPEAKRIELQRKKDLRAALYVPPGYEVDTLALAVARETSRR